MQRDQRVAKVFSIQISAFIIRADNKVTNVIPSACCACFSNGCCHYGCISIIIGIIKESIIRTEVHSEGSVLDQQGRGGDPYIIVAL